MCTAVGDQFESRLFNMHTIQIYDGEMCAHHAYTRSVQPAITNRLCFQLLKAEESLESCTCNRNQYRKRYCHALTAFVLSSVVLEAQISIYLARYKSALTAFICMRRLQVLRMQSTNSKVDMQRMHVRAKTGKSL